MKNITFILLLLLFIFSCRPSARFAANRNNQQEQQSFQAMSIESDEYFRTYISNWLNRPYRYGGRSRQGVDCSGLTSLVMEEFFGIQIPRSSEEQFKYGEIVRDGFIQTGDLIFFRNVRGVGVDHVGIYLGDNKFVHASSSQGVIISKLDEAYYRKRYAGARRYLEANR